jgi:cysteine dioxygenase
MTSVTPPAQCPSPTSSGAIRLSALFAELDTHPTKIPLDVLQTQLSQLAVTWDDLLPWIRFCSERYLRNLVHEGPAYQALLLCWRNGQRSPIHDHRGSTCGLRVIRGTATETIFERAANGMIYATVSAELNEGLVACSEDSDIHQISNLQCGNRELVTLHIYSPPLITMGTYSLHNSIVTDQVEFLDEYCDGAGI